MNYLTVKDLKQTRKIWAQLNEERELIITKDGKPCAVLVEVTPENCDESLKEIRRALFSSAVARIRRKAADRQVAPEEVDVLISESRQTRGVN